MGTPPKIRIGIIGAGWWAAEHHIPVLQGFDDVEVVGLCRLGVKQLREVQEKFRVPIGTENFEGLLGIEGLDGVVVSSPHHLHFQHSEAALKRGIHVVCEKPMTLVAAEARRLASLTESNRLHFVIPFGWNYTEYAAVAREKIHSGEIGEIQHVHCHMASALRDLFSGDGAWFAQQAFFQPETRTWSDPSVGGGFGHGQLTHALGLLFWITDLEPSEVFAFTGHSKTGADLSNAISCRFRNGATGTIGGSGTMPPGSTYQVDLRVFGAEGMLLLDIERPRLEIRRNDGRNFSMTMTEEPGAYSCVEPLRVFIDLIQGKPAVNRSSASIGARTVEVLDGAFQSVSSGKVATVEA